MGNDEIDVTLDTKNVLLVAKYITNKNYAKLHSGFNP